MATTEEYKNGGSASYSFSIEKIKDEDIKVAVDGTNLTYTATNPPAQTTEYTVNGSNVIFKQASVSGSANGGVRIYRETALENSDSATFVVGSAIRAADLNANHKLVRFSAQEQNQKITTADVRDDAITNAKIADDAVDTAQIANGAVDTQQLAANSVNADKIADDVINSEHYVAYSIDTEHYAPGSVDAAALGSNAVTRVKIIADAVNGDKIADDSINSEHYVNGSIDHVHLANDVIDGDNIQDDVINSEHYVAGSIDEEHIANSAVTTNKIANNAVDTTELANGAVTAAKIGADAVDNTKIADNSINSEHYVDGSIDTIHLAANCVTSGKIADNAINTTDINDAAVTISKINNAAIVTNSEQASHSVNDITFFTTAAAEARYFNASTGETIKDGQSFPDNDTTIATTAAINDRIIDLVDDVGGFRPIPNQNSFPSTNPDVNGNAGTIVSVKEATTNLTAQSGTTLTLPNGRGTGNAVIITGVSATIPQGFGFLVETTSTDHTYTFHRLVPKATEVTTVAGKATEIGRLGTTAAVADMAILGTANNVTNMGILGTNDVVADMNILATNDVVADLNTLATADVVNDMNILGTSANVTAMDNCSGSIASINNASSNLNSINNFGDQYQVASNNPSTDGGGNALAAGDLYFNTSANELKVYNGSAWQAGVTATGNFALTTGNTFTGDNRYNDGVKALYGTGSDLEIYHSGTYAQINDTAGSGLVINTNDFFVNTRTSEQVIRGYANADVELFYDGVKKFETSSTGGILSGTKWTFLDNTKGAFGTGDDLQIYHDGSSSYIKDNSNQLYIRANAAIKFENDSGSETFAKFHENGNCELYHDNNKRFTTESYGTVTHGTLHKILGGEGESADLLLFADEADDAADKWKLTSATDGSFYLQNYTNGSSWETNIKTTGNGAVELYHNNSKKLETYSNGVEWHGNLKSETDGDKIALGAANDLQIYHSGSHSFIDHTNGTGHLIINSSATNNVDIMRAGHGEYMARFKPDNAAELYYDNSKKFETTSAGAAVIGSLFLKDASANTEIYYDSTADSLIFKDNKKAAFGDGSDLQIYHDATNSYLDNSTGEFFIRNNSNAIKIRPKNDEESIVAHENGAVELFHNNSKKFETGHGGEYGSFQARNGNNGWDGMAVGNSKFVFMGSNASDAVGIWNDNANEWMIKCIADGSTKLYYNGNETFQTQSDGVAVEGSNPFLRLNGTAGTTGNTGIFLNANANHWLVKADNYSSGNQFQIRAGDTSSSELALSCAHNGAAQLYYDNSRKFRTYGSGVVVEGILNADDSSSIRLGNSDDLQIYHDGTYNVIKGTGNHRMDFYTNGTLRTCIQSDGHLRPASNNTYQLGTSVDRWNAVYAYTTNISSQMFMPDNGQIRLGNSDDLQIYHDGSNSYINNTNSKLYIKSPDFVDIRSTGNETMIKAIPDGAVELYYNNSKKFHTGSEGTYLRGTVHRCEGLFRPYANNTYDLGSTSDRWRNIYTNDLCLSNEGSANDVDGTWGDYTIQEGESDLFLKNNRSGKKYKFNLTEVS